MPGWYATYWIKMVRDIEVLDEPDDNYWTKTAYRIPDTPHANMAPNQPDVRTIPISRMVPRSFITNVRSGDHVPMYPSLWLRGIAFGGDCGVAHVEVSIDGGANWLSAGLGKDEGKYSFREWQTQVRLPSPGRHNVMVRCINSKGEAQPAAPNWNPSGFMRNVIESINLVAVSGE